MTLCVSWMRGVMRRGVDAQEVIDARRQRAALAAGDADGDDAAGAARVDGAQDVGCVAAGRDREGDVAAAGERFDLLAEHLLVAEVVGDAGQRRAVRGQGDRRQRRAVEQVAVGELGRQVLRVGGAAAVAEEEQRATVAEGGDRDVDHPRQGVGMACDELALGFGRWRRRSRGCRPGARSAYSRAGEGGASRPPNENGAEPTGPAPFDRRGLAVITDA